MLLLVVSDSNIHEMTLLEIDALASKESLCNILKLTPNLSVRF
jgi:hypothetical protein